MGNSLSAISDDVDDYLALCQQFGERPRADDSYGGFDCYGDHAQWLEKRNKGEAVEDFEVFALRQKKKRLENKLQRLDQEAADLRMEIRALRKK